MGWYYIAKLHYLYSHKKNNIGIFLFKKNGIVFFLWTDRIISKEVLKDRLAFSSFSLRYFDYILWSFLINIYLLLYIHTKSVFNLIFFTRSPKLIYHSTIYYASLYQKLLKHKFIFLIKISERLFMSCFNCSTIDSINTIYIIALALNSSFSFSLF